MIATLGLAAFFSGARPFDAGPAGDGAEGAPDLEAPLPMTERMKEWRGAAPAGKAKMAAGVLAPEWWRRKLPCTVMEAACRF